MIENLATATPVEIDTYWATLKIAKAQLVAERNRLIARAHYAVGDTQTRVSTGRYTSTSAWGLSDDEALVKLADLAAEGTDVDPLYPVREIFLGLTANEEKLHANSVEQDDLSEVWYSRGGWTRAFLVNNSNGHVHKDESTNCSRTLTTDHYWITALSGHDEAEIVEKAGERACTVCYPSAPVDVLRRKTTLFTPDEQAAAKERAEKAAAKAAKAAEAVLDEDGNVLFKTVRGATNAVAGRVGDIAHYRYRYEGDEVVTPHPSEWEWFTEIREALEALEAKGAIESAEAYYTELAAKKAKARPAEIRKGAAEAERRGWTKYSGYREVVVEVPVMPTWAEVTGSAK